MDASEQPCTEQVWRDVVARFDAYGDVIEGSRNFVLRGPIQEIALDGSTIRITRQWTARNDGTGWYWYDNRPISVNTTLAHPIIQEDGSFGFNLRFVGEVAVLSKTRMRLARESVGYRNTPQT
jgi:hypothetical protein